MNDNTQPSNKIILALTIAQVRALRIYRKTATPTYHHRPNDRTAAQLVKLRLLDSKTKRWRTTYRITRAGRQLLALLKTMRIAVA